MGTNVPKPFVPGVRKGFFDQCNAGGEFAGQKVSGVRMVLKDGAHHIVDSSEWAFYQASQLAYRDCVEDGTWVVLEPIMTVEVNSPIEFTSSVFSMLTKRSGMVTGQDGRDDWFTVEAEVPLNRMFGFSGELRGLTQGKGEYTMEYSRYSPATSTTQETVIQEYHDKIAEIGRASCRERV